MVITSHGNKIMRSNNSTEATQVVIKANGAMSPKSHVFSLNRHYLTGFSDILDVDEAESMDMENSGEPNYSANSRLGRGSNVSIQNHFYALYQALPKKHCL